MGMKKPPALYNKLEALLQRLIGPLKEDELLRIMNKRIEKPDHAMECIASDPALLEELGKHDKAMMQD
eukprot:2767606-Pyramimonas_sp.AAC.1